MRKYILMFAVLWGHSVYAQTQEMEQLKLNMQKLAQLKLMLSQAKQGYQSLQNGYNAVRDAAKGNYDLHRNYLDGLLQVNDKVKHAPALKRMMDNSTLIAKEFREWYSKALTLGVFKARDLSAIKESYQQVVDRMSENLEELQLLLLPGSLRMSDAERITAIEMLSGKTDQQLTALRQYINEQTAIAADRVQNEKDKQRLLQLYGLH